MSYYILLRDFMFGLSISAILKYVYSNNKLLKHILISVESKDMIYEDEIVNLDEPCDDVKDTPSVISSHCEKAPLPHTTSSSSDDDDSHYSSSEESSDSDSHEYNIVEQEINILNEFKCLEGEDFEEGKRIINDRGYKVRILKINHEHIKSIFEYTRGVIGVGVVIKDDKKYLDEIINVGGY